MNKTQRAIVRAFEIGYRVCQCGCVVGPWGAVPGIQIQRNDGGKRRIPYRFITVRLDGKQRPIPVHRLAAFQKFGRASLYPGKQTRHLDSDSLNNALDNIGIGTPTENQADIPKEKRVSRALNAAAHQRKFTSEEARQIRIMARNGRTPYALAKQFGVADMTVRKIVYGRTYLEPEAQIERHRDARRALGCSVNRQGGIG